MAKVHKLSKKELAFYQDLLVDLRRRVVAARNALEGACVQKNAQELCGDLSAHPVHLADIATEAFETQFGFDLVGREDGIISEIDRALEKIREGTYGICEKYQVPIPRRRLRAMPYARYCVQAQQEIER
ncbi:MAG: TraR/DksA C4-type zinc finger protein [Candidatus Omnitrophica bacterium]|nr:TraR/DksA C4-type zinc finger protein [Candidatus Omnitrophota bacterium]